MSLILRCCMAALFSHAFLSVAHAGDPPQPPADNRPRPPLETIQAAPLHLVALNDRMRMQAPYVAASGAAPVVLPANVPAGQMLAGGLLGGLLVAGIEQQRLKEARATVQPAFDLLREHHCLLDGSAAFMDAVERVARGDAQPPVARHVLTGKQTMDDLLSAKDERHVVLISYALTPDLEHLLTTVQPVYAPAGKNGKKSRVAWDGQLTVASPGRGLPAKTAEDIQRLVEEENQRWAASGNDDLVKAANNGDLEARRQVVVKHQQHQSALKQARSTEWSVGDASIENARAWVADDCALLRRAVETNAGQVAALLPRLYANDLLPFPKPGFWQLVQTTPQETRDGMVIRSSAPAMWLSWPSDSTMPGRHPSAAWMPDEKDGG